MRVPLVTLKEHHIDHTTQGVLCFLQEILATHFAGVPTRKPLWVAPWYEHALAKAKIDGKAFKMALYGFLVSAPMGHYLVGALQKAFAGRTGRGAKIGQVLASNLFVSPIQAAGACYCSTSKKYETHLLVISLSFVHGGDQRCSFGR